MESFDIAELVGGIMPFVVIVAVFYSISVAFKRMIPKEFLEKYKYEEELPAEATKVAIVKIGKSSLSQVLKIAEQNGKLLFGLPFKTRLALPLSVIKDVSIRKQGKWMIVSLSIMGLAPTELWLTSEQLAQLPSLKKKLSHEVKDKSPSKVIFKNIPGATQNLSSDSIKDTILSIARVLIILGLVFFLIYYIGEQIF